jgi:trimethylamine---corrinoid protein Co-methyltransferase
MKQPNGLLDNDLVERVHTEAVLLLSETGIKVQSADARQLLGDAGAQVDDPSEVVRLSDTLIAKALTTVPHQFYLYNLAGEPTVDYGGDKVHFDPGSSGVHILDPETLEHYPSRTADLVRIVKITEMLPQFAAQSTAVVCNEVPKEIGDFYRLFIVLLYSAKPIVTGSFSTTNTQVMFDLMALLSGGRQALAKKPRAVFDVCPSPPLIWSDFASQSLIDLARANVPAEIVSMPLAGAAAPVTLIGSIVQHAAECLGGITIHQLANPGAPIVWGGAPAIFDMRKGTTPMGAIETAMIDAACAQVGKSLGVPTHAYLGATDAKIIDAQAGLESGMTALVGALAGINMISGAGMLDFLACFSPEKLIIDAEAIAMVQRLLNGINIQTNTLALEMFSGINFKGDFLKQPITRKLFSKEQYLPSPVIDRDSLRGWQEAGSLDAFARAKQRAKQLTDAYQAPVIPEEQKQALIEMVTSLAKQAGMAGLPEIDLAP